MERYFPKVARASNSNTSSLKNDNKKPRYHPYKPTCTSPERELPGANFDRPERRFTVKELNRILLNSLSDGCNPITHSDARDRADRVVSVSTGHQVNEERVNRKLYLEDRERKLSMQQDSGPNSNGVLRAVRVYLSGYLNGTTSIEMKRMIIEAGGQAHDTHPMYSYRDFPVAERIEDASALDNQDEKPAIRGSP